MNLLKKIMELLKFIYIYSIEAFYKFPDPRVKYQYVS